MLFPFKSSQAEINGKLPFSEALDDPDGCDSGSSSSLSDPLMAQGSITSTDQKYIGENQWLKIFE